MSTDKLPSQRPNRNSMADNIREHIMSPRQRPELTDAEAEYLDRLKSTHAMVLELRPRHEIVKLIAKRFDITDRHAQRMVKEAINLFGDIYKQSKEGHRAIVAEMIMSVWKKAEEVEDLETQTKIISTYIKAFALDKEDPDMPDFEKLAPPMVVINVPDQVLQNLDKMFAGQGVINLSQHPETFSEFEEVNEEEE